MLLNRVADMEIQCKSSAMQYPFYCNSASGSLCTVQVGQVDTHALYNCAVEWCPCKPPLFAALPHIMPAGLYAPHYCTTMGCIAGAGYMGGVKLDDTSHRAHGTKVLTCTSVSSIVARNTDASKKRILFDCSWSLTCCYNHICVFLSFYSR